jgi:hypothetical protein
MTAARETKRAFSPYCAESIIGVMRGIARPAMTGRYHAKNIDRGSSVGSRHDGVRLDDTSKRAVGL